MPDTCNFFLDQLKKKILGRGWFRTKQINWCHFLPSLKILRCGFPKLIGFQSPGFIRRQIILKNLCLHWIFPVFYLCSIRRRRKEKQLCLQHLFSNQASEIVPNIEKKKKNYINVSQFFPIPIIGNKCQG